MGDFEKSESKEEEPDPKIQLKQESPNMRGKPYKPILSEMYK